VPAPIERLRRVAQRTSGAASRDTRAPFQWPCVESYLNKYTMCVDVHEGLRAQTHTHTHTNKEKRASVQARAKQRERARRERRPPDVIDADDVDLRVLQRGTHQTRQAQRRARGARVSACTRRAATQTRARRRRRRRRRRRCVVAHLVDVGGRERRLCEAKMKKRKHTISRAGALALRDKRGDQCGQSR
jgi:hypothetical protein